VYHKFGDVNRVADLNRSPVDPAMRILERISDAFFAIDPEWRFTYVNPQAEKILDRKPGELIGQELWKVYPGLVGSDFETSFRRAVIQQIASSVTAYYPDHDRWYEMQAYPALEGITVYLRDVSATKRAETDRTKLTGETERLRRLYETTLANTAEFNLTFDVNGRLTFANAAFLLQHGLTREAAIGRDLSELQYPASFAARLNLQIQKVIATRQPLRERGLLTLPSGARVYDYHLAPVIGPEGAIEAVVATAREAIGAAPTPAKKESELRHEKTVTSVPTADANVRFRVFFEQGTQFAGVLTLQGLVVEANRLCLDGCGYTREQVIGKPFWECPWWSPAPDLIEMVRDGFARAVGGEVFRQESQYFVGDGTVRIVDLVLAPAVDAEGNVDFIAATGTDITERKLAESNAREGEARFRNMADSAPVLIWETGDMGINFVNQQYLAFFGRPFEELVGMAWTRYIHPDDAQTYVRIYREAYARREHYEAPARFLRHDGQYRWLLNSGSPNHAVNGTFLGFIGSSADVTDLKHAEDTLRGFAAELARADQQKDEFLALLSHELRNPLAPLRNGLQIMRLSMNDPEVLTQSRDMMERQLSHMVRLIDDLLDISRIGQNKMELRKTRATLREIIDSALETARPAIAAGSHDLAVTLPGDPVHLDADVTRLAQVVANLLINSAKYTPSGGRIWLTAEKIGNEVAIAVKDTGIGIPPDALTSIFNMFSQVDRSIERTAGGLGIGLALVKGLVALHGGTVIATSDGPNTGSTFTVRLPVPVTRRPGRAADGRNENPTTTAPKRRVLVVDDNRDSALSMAGLLRLRGSETTTAHDGLTAIRLAEEFRPDVILMDIGMPELNGYDATRRIREQPWGKKIIIVALTGWGQDSDRADSSDAGCNGHLVKPVRLADLEELLLRLEAGERERAEPKSGR
jgi:PAS domain S-box-containing protein